jgi:hypothetical protein
MPKSTHFHQVRDAQITDKKFRPEDEGIYQEEKHELQGSEKAKKPEARTEEEFVTEQDEKNEG